MIRHDALQDDAFDAIILDCIKIVNNMLVDNERTRKFFVQGGCATYLTKIMLKSTEGEGEDSAFGSIFHLCMNIIAHIIQVILLRHNKRNVRVSV